MNLVKNFHLMAFVVFAILVSCSKDSSFSLLPEADSFTQATAYNSKVDILWLIDNSASMQTSQQNVANNLNSFIQDFTNKGLDYKMAVTTTDAYKYQFNGNHNCSTFRDGIRNLSCATISGRSYSGVRVLSPSTLDLQSVFMTNVSLTDDTAGIYGSSDERAFQSIMRTFEEPNNAGFLRPDSFLSVIIVSDEDDFSHDTSDFTEVYTDPSLYTISSVTSYLDTLTGSIPTDRRYNVHGMSVYDEACKTALGGVTKVNQRYALLIDEVNSAFNNEELKGKKTSLCGNFSDDLKAIADSIQTLSSKFKLQRIPKPETIIVYVNGAVVPHRDTNPLHNGGWFYDVSSNSIFFTNLYKPIAGSSIQVVYDPMAYGS